MKCRGFFFKPLSYLTNTLNNQTEVRVDPYSFSDGQKSLSHINEKWFINLSSTIIPNIQVLFQLEGNFCLSVFNTDRLTVDFIKH